MGEIEVSFFFFFFFFLIKMTKKVPLLQMETTKSYYNLRFFVGLSVLCHIPDTWAYRAQIEEKKRSQKWFGHSFADLCVFTKLCFF